MSDSQTHKKRYNVLLTSAIGDNESTIGDVDIHVQVITWEDYFTLLL